MIAGHSSITGNPKMFNSADLSPLMRDLRKVEPLTREQEYELFKAFKDGDKEAGDKLITHNQRYVYSIAKQYSRSEEEVMDYFCEGICGLITARDKFDPEYGTKFITYARDYIRREMYFYMINQRDVVKKGNLIGLGNIPAMLKNKFYAENGYFPDINVLRELVAEYWKERHCGEELPNINNDMLGEFTYVSINTPIDEDFTFEESNEYVERTSTENDVLSHDDNSENNAVLASLMKYLSKRERELIKKLYGIGEYSCYTRAEICRDYFITEDDLREIENNLLARMREETKKLKKT